MNTKRRNGFPQLRKESRNEESKDRFGFEPTIWTAVVDSAGLPDAQVRIGALGKLYMKYRPPLKAFLMTGFAWKFRVDEDWVDDCLGSFVENKLLKPEFFQAVDRERGRFRDFLKQSLLNFARDKFRAERKHRQNETELPDSDSGLPRGTTHLRPTADSDIEWARRVLEQALQAMKADCLKRKHELRWAIFERRRLAPLLDSAETESLEDTISFVKRTFGAALSIQEVSNRQKTGERMLGRCLRDILSEYNRDAEEIEEELQEFIELLRCGVHRKNPATSRWRPKI